VLPGIGVVVPGRGPGRLDEFSGRVAEETGAPEEVTADGAVAEDSEGFDDEEVGADGCADPEVVAPASAGVPGEVVGTLLNVDEGSVGLARSGPVAVACAMAPVARAQPTAAAIESLRSLMGPPSRWRPAAPASPARKVGRFQGPAVSARP